MHSPEKIWEETQRSAYKGWAKSPFPDTLLPAAVRQAGAVSPADSVVLLRGWYLAGRGTGEHLTAPLPDPVPAEERPYCNAAAIQLWRDIRDLESAYPLLEKKWLQACASSGQMLAPSLIVEVFNLGATKKMLELRPLIRQVAGNRGKAIAAMHPPWSFALPVSVERTWREGTSAERSDLLRLVGGLRPDAAVNLLASTWEKESVPDKKLFLGISSSFVLPDHIAFYKKIWAELLLGKPHASTRTLAALIAPVLLHLKDPDLEPEYRSWIFEGVIPAWANKIWSDPTLAGPELLGWLAPGLFAGESPSELFIALGLVARRLGLEKDALEQILIKAAINWKSGDWAEALLALSSAEQMLLLLGVMPPEQREKWLMREMGQVYFNEPLFWRSEAARFEWSLLFSQWVLQRLYESWTGYHFSLSAPILQLDVYLHRDVQPFSVVKSTDHYAQQKKWEEFVAPEIEKMLKVKRRGGF